MKKPNPWVEWGGAVAGLVGSALVASNSAYSAYGFPLFLVSNMLWLAFGLKARAWGMVCMQTGFTFTSLLGMYRWLV